MVQMALKKSKIIRSGKEEKVELFYFYIQFYLSYCTQLYLHSHNGMYFKLR